MPTTLVERNTYIGTCWLPQNMHALSRKEDDKFFTVGNKGAGNMRGTSL